MNGTFNRRTLLGTALAGAVVLSGPAFGQGVTLRLSTPATPTDQRSLALTEVFAPAIKDFATLQPHFNATLFKQGTELEAIARGNLDMSITSAQELATLIPAWSIFTAGYLLRDAEHQKKVFQSNVMDDLKKMTEDKLGVKLLTVMYLGRRQVNLRTDKEIKTPADMEGIKLRMPGTEAWLFLGKALGANPTPMAYAEVYTGLQTGAIDGQDNPLPNVENMKFYEVMNQIVMTSHLVGFDLLCVSKKVWDEMGAEKQAKFQAAADAAMDMSAEKHIAREKELAESFKGKGLKIYEPDVAAFRKHVQDQYLASDLAKDWPAGMLDKINAL